MCQSHMKAPAVAEVGTDSVEGVETLFSGFGYGKILGMLLDFEQGRLQQGKFPMQLRTPGRLGNAIKCEVLALIYCCSRKAYVD